MYSGIHIGGEGRGKTLGFPTLNVQMENTTLQQGVFVVEVFIYKKSYFGLMHIGPRPTFHDKKLSIEIFLFTEPPQNTHGTQISFLLLQKIREVITFPSPIELIAQIEKDVQQAKKIIKTISRISL